MSGFEAALSDPDGPVVHGPVALIAVGGYGRGELAPFSDLDVLLLHETRRGIEGLAERIWYPIWDAKLKLGHAVRTPKEALALAGSDLDTATSLLQVRHLAGDASLTEALARAALASWRRRSKQWLTELSHRVEQRHATAGEVAFLLEPNLKDGRGGLRDVHSLRWAAASEPAEIVLLEGDDDELTRCYDVLLDARVELHRLAGRPGDVLALQDQDAVADVLGMADADVLMAGIAAAGRTIAWFSDEAWFRVRRSLSAGRTAARDAPVATGVVVHDGQIHLDATARAALDPTLLLRTATAAARHRTRLDRASLDRLAAETPQWPIPWPAGASDDLVALLLEGHRAIPVLESLDQRGLLTRVLPEWQPVRSRPQRNAYHRFTVDRHLWETAANAADLADRVSRPDLLVLGALLHDLGKGYPGDHTEAGIELVAVIGPRMGLPPADVEVVAQLVRHHLLLSEVATRRDLSDEATIDTVAKAVRDHTTLELLAALTEADSLATGSSAWSPWKAELVRELVDKVDHVLGGGSLDSTRWSLFPSAEVLVLMGEGREVVRPEGDRVTVVAPDRPGLFGRVAGVLSLHGLDVLGAKAHSDEQGMAANEFRVAPKSNGAIAWPKIEEDLRRALQDQLAIEARLAERRRTYSRRRKALSAVPAETYVRVENGASSNATVVEVRCPDAIGVLYRITKALAELGLDIRHAKVVTLGHEVVDTFYVRAAGAKITDPFHLNELERALMHAIGA